MTMISHGLWDMSVCLPVKTNVASDISTPDGLRIEQKGYPIWWPFHGRVGSMSRLLSATWAIEYSPVPSFDTLLVEMV